MENKIVAAFTLKQAERYRAPGEDGVKSGEWARFVTVLVGPRHLAESMENLESIRAGHVNRRESPKGHEAPILTAQTATVAVLTRAKYLSTVAIESPRPLAERLDLGESDWVNQSGCPPRVFVAQGVRRYDGVQKWLNGSACAPGSRNMRTKTTGT